MLAPALTVLVLVAAVAGGAPAAAAAEARWPQFLGRGATGIAPEEDLPDTWSATEGVVWRVEVPGRGWSSPVVWGNRVFLTTVVSEGPEEEPKKGLYLGGERLVPPSSPHRWILLCLSLEDGRVLWQRAAHEGVPRSSRHIKNTFASETPAADAERVYASFGQVGLFAYDHEGKEAWSLRWEPRRTRYGWGTAASPVLWRDRLFVVNDNEEQSFVAAVEARTGKELWRRERDEKSNWSTPFVWENSARTELVTTGSRRVRSYDLEGKLLWELSGMSSITIPTPLERHGLLYVGSGYVLDQARPLYAIRPGASGDISLKEGEEGNAWVAWRLRQGAPYNPTPVLHGDLLYVLHDRGFLSAHDARTGKEVYPRKRLGTAQAFTSSPWAYGGKVFCLSEDGEAFVVKAGPEFELVRTNSLGEMCMASPALAGRSLLLRTLSRLYRIEKGARPRAAQGAPEAR